MPEWTREYYGSLCNRFNKIVTGLDDRLQCVVSGRVAPAVNDLPIGSAKMMRAAVLFFDIRGFTERTGSPDPDSLKKALLALDVVIPIVMQTVFDHSGYVEKNTGDGVMAIIGAEDSDETAANNALSAAVTVFYLLEKLVPYF